MSILCLPCALGFNLLSDIHIGDKVIMDLEDFAVSNVLLPFGSLIYILFCTSRYGMGWKNTIDEANCGSGAKVPQWIRPYVTYILPLIIIALMIMSWI